jgi:hypothetical protein
MEKHRFLHEHAKAMAWLPVEVMREKQARKAKEEQEARSSRASTATLAGLAFINVAKISEIVMRSHHRVGINNHEQPVIWEWRRFVDCCCYFESFVTP